MTTLITDLIWLLDALGPIAQTLRSRTFTRARLPDPLELPLLGFNVIYVGDEVVVSW